MPMEKASVVLYRILIWGGALVLGSVLHRLWPLRVLPSLVGTAGGSVFVAIGTVLLVWAIATMAQKGGSPNPYHPSQSLVTDGPFRFTRNPIYFSFLLLYAGFAFWVNNSWLLTLIPFIIIAMQALIITKEEKDLSQRFGEEYTQYRRQVRRWL